MWTRCRSNSSAEAMRRVADVARCIRSGIPRFATLLLSSQSRGARPTFCQSLSFDDPEIGPSGRDDQPKLLAPLKDNVKALVGLHARDREARRAHFSDKFFGKNLYGGPEIKVAIRRVIGHPVDSVGHILPTHLLSPSNVADVLTDLSFRPWRFRRRSFSFSDPQFTATTRPSRRDLRRALRFAPGRFAFH